MLSKKLRIFLKKFETPLKEFRVFLEIFLKRFEIVEKEEINSGEILKIISINEESRSLRNVLIFLLKIFKKTRNEDLSTT